MLFIFLPFFIESCSWYILGVYFECWRIRKHKIITYPMLWWRRENKLFCCFSIFLSYKCKCMQKCFVSLKYYSNCFHSSTILNDSTPTDLIFHFWSVYIVKQHTTFFCFQVKVQNYRKTRTQIAAFLTWHVW